MNNETQVGIKFENKITNEPKLKRYIEQLKQIKALTNGLNPENIKQIESSSNSLKNIENSTKGIEKTAKTAFNLSLLKSFSRGLKNVSKEIGNLTQKSSEYLENINLFQVAFDGSYQEAEKFVNKMTEMYGLDESWGVRTVGIFKQLSNAMNLSTEEGTKLATLLTQMSVDISSLYNVDIEKASNVLQSALAGQTKPIRGTTGADITQATLQTTLGNLGIDRYVSDLSYAEKRLLIIVSLTQQLTQATGDFGRTIESPANQLRILEEQFSRLSRAVGNLFLPVLGKILPYLNAILMVLTEIISTVARLFGYKEDDYDYFSGTADSVLELEDNLEGAGAAAEKLKHGLRGFDKLNVITTPTSSSSGSASGGAGGIDPAIMKSFNNAYDEYLKKLDNVQMKATKIRDKIMEWLGFQKEINALTGKTEWKYKGMKTTLKNIWDSFKNLSTTGKILAGVLALLFTAKFIKAIKKVVELLGSTGLLKTVKALFSPFKSFYNILDDTNYAETSLGKSLVSANNSWASQLSLLDRVKVTMIGAGGLYAGIQLINSSMKDLAENGEMTAGSMLKLAGGFTSAIAGGALIGSQFGIYGTIIGGVAGGVIALYDAFMKYPTAVSIANEEIAKVNEKTNEYSKSLKEQYAAIEENYIQQMSLQGAYESLLKELDNIVDGNGRVKNGYEDRANFIITTLNNAYGTEIEMIDGVIKQYDDQIKKIQEIILEKRKQIALEKAEEEYKVALDNKVKAYNNLKESQNNYTEAVKNQKLAEEEYNEIMKTNLATDGAYIIMVNKKLKALEEANQRLEETGTSLNLATEAYNSNTNAILNYEGLLTTSSAENADAVEKYINQIENSYYDGEKTIKLTLDQQLDDAALYYASVLKTARENEAEINDTVLSSAESRLNGLNTNLAEMTSSVEGELGDNVISAWGELANSSESKFMEYFKTLPSDIQKNIVDKMKDKGYKISDELQNGINQINPTVEVKTDLSKANTDIKITADTSSAEKSTSNLWTRLKNAFKDAFNMSISPFANGGMPQVGQLFIANERGPELVGQIGGQSFVANQNQMMELLDRKMGSYQPNNNGGIYNIYLDKDHKIATYTLDQLQDMAISNGKPITIGR